MKWYRSEDCIFTNNSSSHKRVHFSHLTTTPSSLYIKKLLSVLNILSGVINAIKMLVLRTLLLCVWQNILKILNEWVRVAWMRRGKVAWKIWWLCWMKKQLQCDTKWGLDEYNIKMDSCHCTWLQYKSYGRNERCADDWCDT